MISMNARRADIVLALLILAACAVLFINTFSMPPPIIKGYPGIAFFPRLVIYFLAALAFVMLIRGIVFHASGDELFTLDAAQIGTTLAYMLAYIVGLQIVGFEISTFILLCVLLWMRLERKVMIPLWSALTVLVFYATFVIFMNVDLPLLFLPRYVTF